MSKNQISALDKDKIDTKINELDFIKNIVHKEFFEWMFKNKYSYDNIKDIFEAKKISAIEQHNFNLIIRRFKEESKVSLTELILLFEDRFTTFAKILTIFDEDTISDLKKELSINYHIKLDETNLKLILN